MGARRYDLRDTAQAREAVLYARLQRYLSRLKADRPLSIVATVYQGWVWVDWFEITEGRRGCGEGRRALEKLRHWAHRQGLKGLRLRTLETARGFYLACGCRPAPAPLRSIIECP